MLTVPVTLLSIADRVYRHNFMNIVKPSNIEKKSCPTTCFNTTDCQW